MIGVILAFFTAFWLGMLTSISPCPLASNIAAVSFLSKKITNPKSVLFSGIAYSLGRMLTYAVLGFFIVYSLISIPSIANFLQKYMGKFLGPILIISGLYLLDVFKFSLPDYSISEKKQNSLADSGIKGSFALGFIFALSFCPISAGLFFGSLIPLALNNRLGIIFPFVYGIGTGLPVLIFSVGIALGMKSLSRWFNRIKKIEIYMRKLTGIVFILVGLYYAKIYLFGIF